MKAEQLRTLIANIPGHVDVKVTGEELTFTSTPKPLGPLAVKFEALLKDVPNPEVCAHGSIPDVCLECFTYKWALDNWDTLSPKQRKSFERGRK